MHRRRMVDEFRAILGTPADLEHRRDARRAIRYTFALVRRCPAYLHVARMSRLAAQRGRHGYEGVDMGTEADAHLQRCWDHLGVRWSLDALWPPCDHEDVILAASVLYEIVGDCCTVAAFRRLIRALRVDRDSPPDPDVNHLIEERFLDAIYQGHVAARRLRLEIEADRAAFYMQ